MNQGVHSVAQFHSEGGWVYIGSIPPSASPRLPNRRPVVKGRGTWVRRDQPPLRPAPPLRAAPAGARGNDPRNPGSPLNLPKRGVRHAYRPR